MHFGGIFDFDSKSERLEEVVRELESPAIWDNPEQAQALGRERAQLEAVVHQLQQLGQSIIDLTDLFEMAREEDDEGAVRDVALEVDGIVQQVDKLEFRRMFAGDMDNANAFLDIQSGSGGTEAQDWAEHFRVLRSGLNQRLFVIRRIMRQLPKNKVLCVVHSL